MAHRVRELLMGALRLRITGPFVERFLNLCTRGGLQVWDIERTGERELLLTTTPAHFKRMRQAAFRSGVRVKVLEQSGLPARLPALKKRRALLAGVLLFFCLLFAASRFVWEITIEGCESLDPAEVLDQLAQLGLRRGAYVPGLDVNDLSLSAQLAIPKLSFIAINLSGTRAQVVVRERVLPPGSLEHHTPRNLVAARDGQIVDLLVYEGEAVVRRGDTVQQGDLLVSGALSSKQVGTRYVAADAVVTARTWRSGTIKAQRVATEKRATGRTVFLRTLLMPGFEIKMYLRSGISMAEYATLITEDNIRLPFGIALPIGLRTEARMEQVTLSRVLSDAELEQLCLNKLQEVAGELEPLQPQLTHRLVITEREAVLTFEAVCVESIVQPVELVS